MKQFVFFFQLLYGFVCLGDYPEQHYSLWKSDASESHVKLAVTSFKYLLLKKLRT